MSGPRIWSVNPQREEVSMHGVINVFAIIGAVVVVYGGARVVATAADIFQRSPDS